MQQTMRNGFLACLCICNLLAGPPLQQDVRPPADSISRAERWAEQRREKAEHLTKPDPGPVEAFFIEIEESVDAGVLGWRVAGHAVYTWLLVLGTLSIMATITRSVHRMLARRLPTASARDKHV